MRFYEILNEGGSGLAPKVLASFAKIQGGTFPRQEILINKVRKGDDFLTTDEDEDGNYIKVKIDKSILPELEKAFNSREEGSSGSMNFPTDFPLVGGGTIRGSKLAKTGEFGGTAGGDKINRGELAEGWHALAAFVRIITRPSKDITIQDLLPFIPKIKNGQEYVAEPKEVDSDVVDKFTLYIALKKGTWDAFQQPEKALADKVFKKLAQVIVDDANKDTGRYADDYASNNKVDAVDIVGDGVSGETQTKTDIVFKYKGETVKVRGYSIKAGDVAQIHQVAGGGVDQTKAGFANPQERYRILADEVFGVNGRALIADISGAKNEIILAASTNDYQGRAKAQNIAYAEAAKSLKQKLSTDTGDKKFLQTFVAGLKYMLRRDEEGVLLKQFSEKGTYILDAELLNKLYEEEGFDLDVKLGKQGNGLPYIDIFDVASKLNLLRIRTYKAKEYLRNYYEKGKLFSQLTRIRA